MASNSEVKLLGAWPSDFVMRARIALNIKKVDYELLEETFGTKSELLLQSNPVYKKIPVLIHAGKPICESLIIVEYIDEIWASAPSILPSDPYDRAIARFWATYIDDKWFPSLKGIAGFEDEDQKATLIGQLEEGLALIEGAYGKCSKGKTFFGGDQIGFLDIAFGSYLGWLRVTEKINNLKFLDETKLPGLAKWANSFCSEDAVHDVMPETEKLMEFAKLFLAKHRASTPAK